MLEGGLGAGLAHQSHHQLGVQLVVWLAEYSVHEMCLLVGTTSLCVWLTAKLVKMYVAPTAR